MNLTLIILIRDLSLFGWGANISQDSGLLCLAMVCGAIVPVMKVSLTNKIGPQFCFVLPLLCYFYIAYFGVFGSTPHSNITQSKPSGVLL
jgi:FHS family L-fucose permease-like MFS transporter